eukprot:jgi/Picsp_1/4745/NSC_02114-R1_muts protein homolog 4
MGSKALVKAIDQSNQRQEWIVTIYCDSHFNVGMAALEAESGCRLVLAEFVETRTEDMSTMRSMLQGLPPLSVAVPCTLHEFAEDLQQEGDLEVYEMKQCVFDGEKGLSDLKYAALGGDKNSNDYDKNSRSSSKGRGEFEEMKLACRAVAGLMVLIETEYHLYPTQGSWDVEVVEPQEKMKMLSVGCVACLNLLQEQKSIGGHAVNGKKAKSLYQLLVNWTRTKIGAAALRSNMLQPLCCIEKIRERQDAVQELVMDQKLLHDVGDALGKLPADLKKCLRSVCLNMQRTKKNTSKRITSMVQGFIELKQHCVSLSPLSEALSNATSRLLRMYNDRIGENSSLELMELLDNILDDGLKGNSSKTAFMNRTQQCYALKRGLFPLLDTYRREYSACAQQVHDLANSLRSQHESMAGLAVNYTEQRGFYFTLSKRFKAMDGSPLDLTGAEDASPLPKELITLHTDARQLQCTTDELNALNSRMIECSNLCLELTESILYDQCLSIVEQHLGKVKKQIDSIAELDMTVAFAHMAVSQDGSYVKPVFTASGPLVIQDGRHATMEHCVADYVSNDVVMSPENTLQLILGPNMAGKTTYLKMTGLLIIMAQMGSFVPASFVSLSPFDRMMAIMPAASASQGSSLSNEMRQVAHVVSNVGPRSLVLLDELARSTGSGEGLALAWSIAEYLALQGCKTLFSTHMAQLSKLSMMYPMCSVFHFVWKASDKGDDDKSSQPRKLKHGAPEFTHYGVDLAEAMGLPEGVVSRAKESLQGIENDLSSILQIQRPTTFKQEALALEVRTKLVCIKEAFESSLDESELMKSIENLKQSLLS